VARYRQLDRAAAAQAPPASEPEAPYPQP
jgi:hypothetical protein